MMMMMMMMMMMVMVILVAAVVVVVVVVVMMMPLLITNTPYTQKSIQTLAIHPLLTGAWYEVANTFARIGRVTGE